MALRLTLHHRYAFDTAAVAGDLRTPADWDRLRAADAAFGFGPSIAGWRAQAESNGVLRQRAAAIAFLLDGLQCDRLVSVGAGTGMLEHHLLEAAPGLRLRAGDFAPLSVAALAERLPRAEVEVMDLARPREWARPDEAVLLHRVDMELDAPAWRRVFADLHAVGAAPLVWVPCGLLTPLALARELRTALAAAARRRRLAHAGFLRTEAAMRDLFAGAYRLAATVAAPELPVWVLQP